MKNVQGQRHKQNWFRSSFSFIWWTCTRCDNSYILFFLFFVGFVLWNYFFVSVISVIFRQSLSRPNEQSPKNKKSHKRNSTWWFKCSSFTPTVIRSKKIGIKKNSFLVFRKKKKKGFVFVCFVFCTQKFHNLYIFFLHLAVDLLNLPPFVPFCWFLWTRPGATQPLHLFPCHLIRN